jgi:hypothetical protein
MLKQALGLAVAFGLLAFVQSSFCQDTTEQTEVSLMQFNIDVDANVDETLMRMSTDADATWDDHNASSCFPKDTPWEDNPNQVPWGEVWFTYKNGEFCIDGNGYESRAQSTIKMIQDAVRVLEAERQPLPNLGLMKVSLHDMPPTCKYNFSFVTVRELHCATKLVPDYTFESWPQVKVPNFDSVARLLPAASQHPAKDNRCGWAGDITHGPNRPLFAEKANRSLIDVRLPKDSENYLTWEEQVKQWACMIDLQGDGYSGRVPMLFHTGRPVLIVARQDGGYVDNTFYAQKLLPSVHFFPIKNDLSDLNERARWVLDPANSATVNMVVQNALDLAKRELTYSAAILDWTQKLKQVW